MTLAELRKFSIRKQYRIHFRLRNAMECIISEHGIAKVPDLKKSPDFDLEEELAAAGEFLIEPAVIVKSKKPETARMLRREELAQLMGGAPAAAAAHDEHDDE